MSSPPSVEAAWRSHRPYLVNLAYQMLGDVGEAEDVAQEAFLRLSRTDPSQIDDVRAWLTVVAGRLCLDQLRSARARHEQPDESGALGVTRSRAVEPSATATCNRWPLSSIRPSGALARLSATSPRRPRSITAPARWQRTFCVTSATAPRWSPDRSGNRCCSRSPSVGCSRCLC